MPGRREIDARKRCRVRLWLLLAPAFLALAGCSAGLPETVVETAVVTQIVEAETSEIQPTGPSEEFGTQPAASPSPPGTPAPGATPAPEVYETRRVVLEWPPHIPVGETAIVRLSFDPEGGQLDAEIESQGARLATGSVDIRRLPQYDVRAAASLEGLGFEISPVGEQVRLVTEGEPLEWRWTVSPLREGVQRMNVLLALRWYPAGDTQTVLREAVLYAKGLEVQVPAAAPWGNWLPGLAIAVALALGGGYALLRRRARFAAAPPGAAASLADAIPNPAVVLEPHPRIRLSGEETDLFQAVFSRYGRLLLEREYESGYSGARTFLVQPIRPDGGADAHTILKIGPPNSVLQEYDNYRRFVADTLPPITARIQQPPLALPGGGPAALRYTFVAEPGRPPAGLRTHLLQNPDPRPLQQLFDTFGPGWWMQRHPYTFRLAQAYDRKLPVHALLSPAPQAGSPGRRVTPNDDPAAVQFVPGEHLALDAFPEMEMSGGHWTLLGRPTGGGARLRLRWLDAQPPQAGSVGAVSSTRETFLRQRTHEMPRYGLPDPLPRLPDLLNEIVRGTRSIIHGDLNLENILVGPGGMVWLIDFAMTREGHTLYDFAHLETELIAHVLAPQVEDPQAFIDVLRNGRHPLLGAVESLAARCLFNREQPREYDLALALSCLGALKFQNLDAHQRHLLYLAAAWLLRES